MHLYILTLNCPKFHSLSGCCMCAVQFGHFGKIDHLPDLRARLLYIVFIISSPMTFEHALVRGRFCIPTIGEERIQIDEPLQPLFGASLNCRLCFFPRDLRGPDSCSLGFLVTFLFSPVYRLPCFVARDVRGVVSCSLVFALSFSLMVFHLSVAGFPFS